MKLLEQGEFDSSKFLVKTWAGIRTVGPVKNGRLTANFATSVQEALPGANAVILSENTREQDEREGFPAIIEERNIDDNF